MRGVVAALLLALGAVALLALPREARAEAPIEVYQVQCMAELDVLEIRLLDLADETKRQLVTRNDKAYTKMRGLFVPALYSHLDLDPADPRYGIEAEKFECGMLSGHAVLTAVPEPIEGHATSIAVTITRDQYLLVDDVPFRHCAGGAPLTGLTYAESAERRRIKLAGRHNADVPEGDWVVPPVRWEREPILRPDNVGYDGIHYKIHEWREYEGCRYQGPGTPTWRLTKFEMGFKSSGRPPPLGDEEIRATTRPVSRSYAKRWDVQKLYQITCLPDLDFFEVRRLDVSGIDAARRARNRKDAHPEERYNLYVPDWYPTAYLVHGLYPPPDPQLPDSIVDTPPTEFDCSLKPGYARLSIWSTWIGEVDGFDIMASLRASGRLLANLVQFEECYFISRLSYRSVDGSIALDGYTRRRFVPANDGSPMLVDDTEGEPSRGRRTAVIGEDPEDVSLSHFYSCRYGGPRAPMWGHTWD